MDTINKTRLSCARVKVQVNFLADFPKFVEIEVVDEVANAFWADKVKI